MNDSGFDLSTAVLLTAAATMPKAYEINMQHRVDIKYGEYYSRIQNAKTAIQHQISETIKSFVISETEIANRTRALGKLFGVKPFTVEQMTARIKNNEVGAAVYKRYDAALADLYADIKSVDYLLSKLDHANNCMSDEVEVEFQHLSVLLRIEQEKNEQRPTIT